MEQPSIDELLPECDLRNLDPQDRDMLEKLIPYDNMTGMHAALQSEEFEQYFTPQTGQYILTQG